MPLFLVLYFMILTESEIRTTHKKHSPFPQFLFRLLIHVQFMTKLCPPTASSDAICVYFVYFISNSILLVTTCSISSSCLLSSNLLLSIYTKTGRCVRFWHIKYLNRDNGGAGSVRIMTSSWACWMIYQKFSGTQQVVAYWKT